MERLTFYDDFRKACYRQGDTVYQNPIAAKLAAYEDAEEQGRLVILPKIQDATIFIFEELPDCRWVTNRPVNYFDLTGVYCGFGLAQIRYDFADMGKTWFLTREEAEAALDALGGGGDVQ